MGHPNHKWPMPSKLWKPSKNHWHQWLDFQKTFNGDGPTVAKPLKNHWCQWWPEKNINHSIALKNWPSSWSIQICICIWATVWTILPPCGTPWQPFCGRCQCGRSIFLDEAGRPPAGHTLPVPSAQDTFTLSWVSTHYCSCMWHEHEHKYRTLSYIM